MRLLPFLVILFMLAEIAVFIWVGGLIGALAVILLVLLSGIIGGALIRRQGLKTLNRLRFAMNGQATLHEPPGAGIFQVIAGLLLMLPGFITDAMAMLLLLPAVQRRLVAKVSGRFAHVRHPQPRGAVIDAEAIEIHEPDGVLPPDPNSPWRR